MKLIVGLGNPGEKYEQSRHNIGFMVVDELLRKLAPVGKTEWKDAPALKSKIYNLSTAKISSSAYNLKSEVVLAKPQAFMNASGFAVKSLIVNYKLPITNLWVIHDDLDLPLGKIKIVRGRASAGHKGIDSIIKELGTPDFIRFRLGIGHPGPKSSDKEVEHYVLSPFGRGEKGEARKIIKKAVEAIETALEESLEKAMNRFN